MSDTEESRKEVSKVGNRGKRVSSTQRGRGRGRGTGTGNKNVHEPLGSENVHQESDTTSDNESVADIEEEIDLTSPENIVEPRNIVASGIVNRCGESKITRGKGRRQHRTPMPTRRHF